MKFLIAGDVHGDLNAFDRLAKKADKENVDAIVLSGDFTFFNDMPKGTFDSLRKTGKKILVIPGNHDSLSTLNFAVEKYGVCSLHGYYFDFGDVAIFGAGGADIGPEFTSSESEFNYFLSRSFDKIKNSKKKLMITHMHPSNSLTEKISGFAGSKEIFNAIKKFNPDIAVFSHIHESHGIEDKIGNTKLFCAGKDGIIIEI